MDESNYQAVCFRCKSPQAKKAKEDYATTCDSCGFPLIHSAAMPQRGSTQIVESAIGEGRKSTLPGLARLGTAVMAAPRVASVAVRELTLVPPQASALPGRSAVFITLGCAVASAAVLGFGLAYLRYLL